MAIGYVEVKKICVDGTITATDWWHLHGIYSDIGTSSVFVTCKKIKLKYRFNW